MTPPPSHPSLPRSPVRVLLAILLVGLLGSCRYEEREVEIGYVGEAKRNPFLAAERLCEAYGLFAETRLSVSDLPPQHTTLVLASDAVESGGAAELIADWVSEGGALIYLVDGGSRFDRDPFALAGEAPTDDYLLTHFEVSLIPLERPQAELDFDGEGFAVNLPAEHGFRAEWLDDTPESWGEPTTTGPVFWFTYGIGDVILISSGSPFRNRQIGELDHATLFWRMIEATGNHSVLFVLGGRISFLGLLWTRGWMAVLPVLLAVGVWVWKSLGRHGPLVPDARDSKLHFAHHVEALGQFLWSRRAVEELLGPVRRRIQLRMHSVLGWEDTEASRAHFHEALAERANLPVERVHQAFTSNPERQPAVFVQVSQDLHTIERSL